MKKIMNLLAVVALLGGISASAEAASIGINYQGVSGGGSALAPSDVAGYLLPQANWNNAVGAGQAPPATPINDLMDDSGNTTTLDITSWTLDGTPQSWTVGLGDNSPDARLNADFSDRRPVITLDQIPYAQYSVAIHYNNNEGPSTSTLNVGNLSRTITTGNVNITPYSIAGYLEGTDANGDTPTNVSVFTGLSGSSLTISLIGQNNNGISAIQIVEVPEPGSMALMGAGMVGLVGIVRRRRQA